MGNNNRHQVNSSGGRNTKDIYGDPGKEGLRILAKMIARVYLDEIACQRRIARGSKPRMYIETIHIKVGGIKDINEQEERHKLHVFLDEALDMMTLKLIGGNQSPGAFEKDGLAIKIKL